MFTHRLCWVAVVWVGVLVCEAHRSSDAASPAAWTGTWRNQLNSTMELHASDGQLTGWYISPVGDAAGKYALSGRYKSDVTPTTLGWTVVWNNAQHDSHSATSWTGQLLTGQPNRLHTTWILVSERPTVSDLWSAAHVGMDVFERVPL